MSSYFEAMALRRPMKTPQTEAHLELRVKRLDALHDAERVFARLYGNSPNAFWLDSSSVGERARFSFIGDSGGPLGALITYDVDAGEVRVERDGEVEVIQESIFDYLGREMRRLRLADGELSFDFNCGFVGYFGYELKADCEGDAVHESSTPDAAFVFADRLIAFDHLKRCTYVLCVTEPDGTEAGERWIGETAPAAGFVSPAGRSGVGEDVDDRGRAG